MSVECALQIEDAFVDGEHLVLKGHTGEHRLLVSESGPSRVWAHALQFAKANGHSVPGAYAAKAVAAVKRVGNITDYQAFIAAKRAHAKAAEKIIEMRGKLGEHARHSGLPSFCSAPCATPIAREVLNPLVVEYCRTFDGTGNLRESSINAIRNLIDATRPVGADVEPSHPDRHRLRVFTCTYSESGSGFDGLISMYADEWHAWADVAERHAAAIESERKRRPDAVKRWWS